MKGNGSEELSKTLKPDGESNIFMYVVGNGAPGAISFPDDNFLFADQLMDTIKEMTFKSMVIYLDSPESEAMFSQFSEELASLNVMALTSSASNETQWGTHCPPDETKKNRHVKTCLSDLFSSVWMYDIANSDLTSDSVGQHFERVKKNASKTTI